MNNVFNNSCRSIVLVVVQYSHFLQYYQLDAVDTILFIYLLCYVSFFLLLYQYETPTRQAMFAVVFHICRIMTSFIICVFVSTGFDKYYLVEFHVLFLSVTPFSFMYLLFVCYIFHIISLKVNTKKSTVACFVVCICIVYLHTYIQLFNL